MARLERDRKTSGVDARQRDRSSARIHGIGPIVSARARSVFSVIQSAKWAKEAAGANDRLLTEFQAVNRKVVNAFAVTANFLGVDQMPCRQGLYSIGPDAFLKKLRV